MFYIYFINGEWVVGEGYEFLFIDLVKNVLIW